MYQRNVRALGGKWSKYWECRRKVRKVKSWKKFLAYEKIPDFNIRFSEFSIKRISRDIAIPSPVLEKPKRTFYGMTDKECLKKQSSSPNIRASSSSSFCCCWDQFSSRIRERRRCRPTCRRLFGRNVSNTKKRPRFLLLLSSSFLFWLHWYPLFLIMSRPEAAEELLSLADPSVLFADVTTASDAPLHSHPPTFL